MNTATAFANPAADALFVNWKANGFDERAHCAWCVRMSQKYAMHTSSEHLRKHPRVRTHRCFIRAINRHIDDDGGHAMAALGRPTSREPLHILCESFDVVWRVFHVIADVVGIDLSVFLPLLKATLRTGMRTGVIDRLSLREQFDRSIDSFCFRCLSQSRRETER